MKLTQKQETFCLYLFQGVPQREAWGKAGYSTKYALPVIDVNASRLANSTKIKLRLAELRQKAEDASVANVLERKQRLTEILRATIPDFVTEDGIKVERKSPNIGAVSEITTKTKVYRKTGEAVNIINLKLHSPIQAADLLNKMDKIYSEGGTVNIDNRKYEVFVISEKAKQLTDRILIGEGTIENTDHQNL